jgi:hypothetical protein
MTAWCATCAGRADHRAHRPEPRGLRPQARGLTGGGVVG